MATNHSHDECRTTRSQQKSRIRVIDVPRCSIIHLPTGASYVALGYVWGQTKSAPTTAPTLDTFPCRLPEYVPQTIEDVFTVVARIGERDIWVDQFCIGNNQDKMFQIRNMDNICENALVTIVAADGDNCEAGLCGVTSRSRLPQPRLTTNAGVLVSNLPHVSAYLKDSKCASRGWTYQEAFLSRRCLFFSRMPRSTLPVDQGWNLKHYRRKFPGSTARHRQPKMCWVLLGPVNCGLQ